MEEIKDERNIYERTANFAIGADYVTANGHFHAGQFFVQHY
jgi:hypothetical protein